MADRVRMEFVDHIDPTLDTASGSRSKLRPQQQPSVLDVSAHQLVDNCDDFVAGILNRTHQPRPSVMQFGRNVSLPFNPWLFYNGLGRIAKTWRRMAPTDVLYHRLPSAADVVALLEERRRRGFNSLRLLFSSPERLMQGFESAPQFTTQDVVQSGLVALPCHIYARDLLILALRSRHNLIPQPDTGWRRGMRVEMMLMGRRLPPSRQWSDRARQVHEQFWLPLDEEEESGGFAIPSLGAGGGGSGHGESSGETESRDPARLLFHMAQPTYIGVRSLNRRNPYGYCVIVFDRNRYIVDTDQRDNALFCLEGSAADCLRDAQLDKTAMRGSPTFVRRIVHDARGDWRAEESAWLSQP